MDLAEGVQSASFVILAFMMIGAALGVVLNYNIVHSAFLLGGVFISIAGIYLLLNADFVASAQVLIYVGAINVLILFAIMLVNKQQEFKPLPSTWIRRTFTVLVCMGLFILLSTMALTTPWPYSSATPSSNTITLIGKYLFSDFLLPFELASVLLLMSMVGAIILARHEYIPDIGTPTSSTSKALKLPERTRELISPIQEENL